MYAIIVHHILVHGQVLKKYSNYKELQLINFSCFWHVNSFALISGIVGYKTHKYSNLLYLWICVVLYSVVIYFFAKKYRPFWSLYNTKLIYELFPVIFVRYWYFSSYFGMYLFLPIINKGVQVLTRKELKLVILSLIASNIIWKDYLRKDFDVFCMNNGNSVLWLLIFYICGTYIGKYNSEFYGKKKIIYCLICIIIFICSDYISYKMNFYGYIMEKGFISKILIFIKSITVIRINSIPMILEAISITLFLMQLRYNKYIAKIITFIGPLTFGILLIHDNTILKENVIRRLFNNYPYDLPLISVIKLIFMFATTIFFICGFIDYIRHLIFTFLRVRKLCIFLEKMVNKIVK